MRYIIKYKIFESKNLFRPLSTVEYTNMVREPNISCFDEEDIRVLSDFFKKNDIEYQFKDVSLLPLPPNTWSLSGENDIDIDIDENVITLSLTNNTTKKFDLRDYRGLSYDEIDALGETDKNWYTLHNFSLVIPNSKNSRFPIVILKSYSEYYIVDMCDDKISSDESDWQSYLCDQLDGLIDCLSHLNIQNEEYKYENVLYQHCEIDEMSESMNRDTEIPKHEMEVIKTIISSHTCHRPDLYDDCKEITLEEGAMQLFDVPHAEFGCCRVECLKIIFKQNRKGKKLVLEVFRTNDEYYMVNVRSFDWEESMGRNGSWAEIELDDPIYSFGTPYYKCDSVDGLVQFIDLVMTW